VSRLILPRHLQPASRERQRGFIINPYMFAAPAGAGLPPTGIGTTPTFYYDGDTSPQWKTTSTSGGACTADGDTLTRADSIAGATIRCFSDVPAVYKAPAISTANGFFGNYAAQPNALKFYTRPTGTAVPSTVTTVGALFTNANAVVIAALQINGAITDNGAGSAYANGQICADLGGYMGLMAYQAGSTFRVQAYNYDGTEDAIISSAYALGTVVIASMKHSGGALRLRINGVEVASVSSGNTQATTGGMGLLGNIHMSMCQLATWNAAITDANMLEVERYFGNKVGITI
jgi:hypothetical protein